MYFTRVGSRLSHKHQAKLERLASDEHSKLLLTFVNYGRKKFCNIGSSIISSRDVLEYLSELKLS